jgi:hypothetical protein
MEVDDIAKPYISNSYEPVGFMDSGDILSEGESMERTPQDKIQYESSEVTDHFPNPLLAFKDGYTFLSLFDSDENSIHRKTNLYYCRNQLNLTVTCHSQWCQC